MTVEYAYGVPGHPHERNRFRMNTMLSMAAEGTTHMSTQENCTRCHGHMAREMCTDLESDSEHRTLGALRCIQCSYLVDEVILRNHCLFNPKTVLVVAAAA